VLTFPDFAATLITEAQCVYFIILFITL